MKRYLLPGFLLFFLLGSVGNLKAQTKIGSTKSQISPIDNLAKKRTQRLKDELFLSQEQDTKILAINKDMLLKLEDLKQKNMDKNDYKKHFDQIENSTKNKIVSLLTPTQRQRFESKLFTEIYQTHVNKRNAVSVNNKK